MSLKGLTPELTASTACCRKKRKKTSGKGEGVRKPRRAVGGLSSTEGFKVTIACQPAPTGRTTNARAPPARAARVSVLARLHVRTPTVARYASVGGSPLPLIAQRSPDQPWEVTLPDERRGQRAQTVFFDRRGIASPRWNVSTATHTLAEIGFLSPGSL